MVSPADIKYNTWRANKCLHSFVVRMTSREKKQVLAQVRALGSSVSGDTLILPYGITVGEFCCMHVLNESRIK